eukprot:7055-Heterococcus_DN1.PRE.2
MACQLVGTMRGQTMTYHDIESASWSYWFAITAFALLLFLPYQRLLFTAAGSMNNAYTIPHTFARICLRPHSLVSFISGLVFVSIEVGLQSGELHCWPDF